MDDVTSVIILFFAGAIAGFVNVMAGGGSLLTVGAMILLGVDPTVANGTNRLGIFSGSLSGMLKFKEELGHTLQDSLPYALCTIPGAIIGALYALEIEDGLFTRLLSIVMLLVIATLLIPHKKSDAQEKKIPSWLVYPLLVLIGFYGGFIQAGVGFLLMFVFRHIKGYNLVKTNAHYAVVVCVYTIPALTIFVVGGSINWLFGGALVAGSFIGARLAVKMAVKKGDAVIKKVIAVVMFSMIVKFLFF